MKLYLEVSTLQEAHFTGIPSVVAQLAAEMLGDDTIEKHFFLYRQAIPANVIETVLCQRDGRQLQWLATNCGLPPIAPAPDDLDTVGIYPNIKTAHFLFAFETQIIHDLSFLITSQFHHESAIRFHLDHFLRDIVTNDLNICVSEATASDLLSYFPEVSPASTCVMPLGVPSLYKDIRRDGNRARKRVEPYVLVLGTLEPRKNIDSVLAFLRDHQRILDHFRFVFTGHKGWGESFDVKLDRYGLGRRQSEGKIFVTGFVSETQKEALVSAARLVIYPSVFEGFGLPVLEALSFGTPVITTASTSLPFVSGEGGFYFDPTDPKSLASSFFSCLAMLDDNEEQLRQSCRRQAEKFSWSRSYALLKDRITVGLHQGRKAPLQLLGGPDRASKPEAKALTRMKLA